MQEQSLSTWSINTLTSDKSESEGGENETRSSFRTSNTNTILIQYISNTPYDTVPLSKINTEYQGGEEKT